MCALFSALTLLTGLELCASEPAPLTTDWVHWRGPQGDGRIPDVGYATSWPEGGLPKRWSVAIGGGYSGIAVQGDKLVTQDRQKEPQDVERVLCFNATNGELIWSQSNPVDYSKLDYGNGPRACPTIVGDVVYTLGSLGELACRSMVDGKLIWRRHFQDDLKGRMPIWGYAASPLVIGDWLIIQPGGDNGQSIMALDRHTGKTVWASHDDQAGYTWPVQVRTGEIDQLVFWTPSHIRGVRLKDGAPLWEVPYEVQYGVAIATPIVHEGLVVVCGYWAGSRAIRLKDDGTAELEWEENRYLRGLMSQPLYKDGLVYLLDKVYGLTCFELATGKKLWDDKNTLTPRDRNPQASLVWIGQSDRILSLNAEGELVMATLSRDELKELARSKIVGETWAHPAYSGKRVFARSDTELVCVELP